MSDLDTFTPEPVRVTAGGRTFDLTPLKIARLSAFTRAVAPVGHLVATGQTLAAIVTRYESMRDTLKAALPDLDDGFIDDLAATEFLTLFNALVTVNQSFFVPLLMSVIAPQALKAKPASADGAPSSQSSAA